MSKAWIEDLWLTEPRETLPDGSKVKIPVPSSVTKSLAAYMKTPEKAKGPGSLRRRGTDTGSDGGCLGGQPCPTVLRSAVARHSAPEPMPSRSRQPWRMIFAQVGMLIRPMPTGHSKRSPWNGSHPRTTCAVVAIFDMRTT